MIKTIKQLEKNLGYKVQNNVFCLAIDTATKSGIAIIYTTEKNVTIKVDLIKIPAIDKSLEEKAEIYEAKLRAFLNEIKLLKKQLEIGLENNKKKYRHILILENSFLKMNVVTFGFLRALQGIIYAELNDVFDEIKIIFPIAARKLVGFESHLPRGTKAKDKKKEIMKWISNIIEEPIADDNIADALLLAFAGIKKEN
jgi:CRISPR/Cas system-associated endoribonuclease Cas2